MSTLDQLSRWLDERGADVRGRAVFKRHKSLRMAPGVAAGIVEALQPTA